MSLLELAEYLKNVSQACRMNGVSRQPFYDIIQYTYYHCSGSRGKCGQGYSREDRLEEALGPIVQAITFDDERMEWIREALKGSQADKRKWKKKQLEKLSEEETRLVNNIDMLYEDRLDGLVSKEYCAEKSGELRDKLGKVREKIKAHGSADI